MFYTWISCKRNESPSQSPARQPVPSTVLSTKQTLSENLQKTKLIHRKFIEGARDVIPYIKGLSEQNRQTIAKCKVRVFFKGTSTIKSLVIHPKDPIPHAQKTDIIYHWKCPAHNCTAEYIGETIQVPERKGFQTI